MLTFFHFCTIHIIRIHRKSPPHKIVTFSREIGDRVLSSFLNEPHFTLYPGSSLKQTDIHNGSTHMHNAFISYCVETTSLAIHSDISVWSLNIMRNNIISFPFRCKYFYIIQFQEIT